MWGDMQVCYPLDYGKVSAGAHQDLSNDTPKARSLVYIYQRYSKYYLFINDNLYYGWITGGKQAERSPWYRLPVIQWLRLHAANAGDQGLIPGKGTKIPHADPTCHS